MQTRASPFILTVAGGMTGVLSSAGLGVISLGSFVSIFHFSNIFIWLMIGIALSVSGPILLEYLYGVNLLRSFLIGILAIIFAFVVSGVLFSFYGFLGIQNSFKGLDPSSIFVSIYTSLVLFMILIGTRLLSKGSIFHISGSFILGFLVTLIPFLIGKLIEFNPPILIIGPDWIPWFRMVLSALLLGLNIIFFDQFRTNTDRRGLRGLAAFCISANLVVLLLFIGFSL